MFSPTDTFIDRQEAGRKLAEKLSGYKDTVAVVYALPRGGVPVGLEIARALNVPLDVVITRKIGHPFSPEFAICAITETGERICNESSLSDVDQSWIEAETETQKKEAKRRRAEYSRGRKALSAKDKVAIIVDDGIATGLTMKAAIMAIKQQGPKKIIAAVPVSPYDVSEELRASVDELVVLLDEKYYRGSVGAYYEHFEQVSDQAVIDCLHKSSQLQGAETGVAESDI